MWTDKLIGRPLTTKYLVQIMLNFYTGMLTVTSHTLSHQDNKNEARRYMYTNTNVYDAVPMHFILSFRRYIKHVYQLQTGTTFSLIPFPTYIRFWMSSGFTSIAMG